MLRNGVLLPILLLFSEISMANTITFLGLNNDNWFIYTLDTEQQDALPIKLLEYENPRSFTYLPEQGLLAYIDRIGLLHLYDKTSKKHRLLQKQDSQDRYTQIRFSADGRLWAVKLPGGTSRQTHLVEINTSDNSVRTHVAKRGSQFDPFMHLNYLYYSSAHCVDDCDPMIWELWRRDEQTGKQRQLTLGESVSREPVIVNDNLFFISNREGYFHIWKMKAEIGAISEAVTTGDVLDNSLASTGKGELFFIRKLPDSSNIMQLKPDNTLQLVPLPNWINDIRELEAHP